VGITAVSREVPGIIIIIIIIPKLYMVHMLCHRRNYFKLLMKHNVIMKFEVLTAMTAKFSVFWEVTLCSLEQCTDVSENPATFIIRVADIRGNTIL
jgi:hypothetical protein